MKKISLIITTIIFLGSSLTAQETTAADLMAKGLYEENINADYTKASEYYQKILDQFSSEKKVAAQATFRLGLCAEKLGQQTAHEYFEDVVEKYPDEVDLVSKARAKLNNSEGLKYFTDVRDGRQYKYVGIGKIEWMAENLAYLPKVSPLNEQGGIWVYDYDGSNIEEAKLTDNYNIYGCLYDWGTALEACPEGWHLSSYEDWKDLEEYLGINGPNPNEDGSDYRNFNKHKKLLDSNKWRFWHYNNQTQFSALPGGTRFIIPRRGGVFYGLGSNADFWTSTDDPTGEPWAWDLSDALVPRFDDPTRGKSVRCTRSRTGIQTDIVYPKIRIVTPKSGDTVIQSVSISTRVEDNIGVEKVEFSIASKSGIQKIGTDVSPSLYSEQVYDLEWLSNTFPDGEYTLSVKVFDYAGNSSTDSIKLTTLNSALEGRYSGIFKDTRDGQEYKYIEISGQVWMAENLNFAHNPGLGSWCYNNLERNCQTYGRLYKRESALVACPLGWHLPSDLEWQKLERNLGMDESELDQAKWLRGDSLRIAFTMISKAGWGKSNGDNSSGLNILPAGIMDNDYFMFKDGMTAFWTSTPYGKSRSWSRSLGAGNFGIERSYLGTETYSYSVRCIKD